MTRDASRIVTIHGLLEEAKNGPVRESPAGCIRFAERFDNLLSQPFQATRNLIIMILKSIIIVFALTITAAKGAAVDLPIEEGQWKGKCSIGWNQMSGQIPQGGPASGGKGAINVGGKYAFIKGKLSLDNGSSRDHTAKTQEVRMA